MTAEEQKNWVVNKIDVLRALVLDTIANRDKRIAELEKENQKLREAAKELLHLHLCEQEGLSSGQPTMVQWLKAVDDLSNLLHQNLQQ